MDNVSPAASIVIEGIDTKQGIARFGGKADRYMKMLRTFAKTLPMQVPSFEDCIDEDKKTAAAEAVHTVKGVAGNLGMTELYDTVVSFEASMRAGAPDQAIHEKMASIANTVAKEVIDKTAVLQAK